MVFSQFSLSFSQSLYFQNMTWTAWHFPLQHSVTDTFVCFPTALNDSGIFTVSLLQCSQWHIQAILAAPWKQPRDSNLHLPQVMGILTHLHTHRSCWTLGWALRDSSAASHWCFSVCLPPSPWVLCKLWHFDIEILIIEEKNQKLLHAFSSKEKRNQEDAWCEIKWNWYSNNWIFSGNFICSKGFSSPPSHCIIPAGPRPVLWAGLTSLGSGATSRQKSWEGVQFVVQL